MDRNGVGGGRRRTQPPRLCRRHPGAGRAGGAHPRRGGQAPGRRGAAADRPRPPRCRRPPHRPGQRPGRGGGPCHGQAPRPGQGGAGARTGGQSLRAQRTARHRRPAAPVRRPRGTHRTGAGPRGARRPGRHLPQRRTPGGGGLQPRADRHARRRRPGRVPDHPGGADQCAQARGARRAGRGQRGAGGTRPGGHRPRRRRGPGRGVRAGERRVRRVGGRRGPRPDRDARAGGRAAGFLLGGAPLRRRLPRTGDTAGHGRSGEDV